FGYARWPAAAASSSAREMLMPAPAPAQPASALLGSLRRAYGSRKVAHEAAVRGRRVVMREDRRGGNEQARAAVAQLADVLAGHAAVDLNVDCFGQGGA